MKHNLFLSLIIFLTMIAPIMASHPKSDLPPPNSVKSMGSPSGDLEILPRLLKEGNLREFYKQANAAYKVEYPKLDDKSSTLRSIWLYYYISNAPLLPFNDYEWKPPIIIYDDKIDLELKREIQERSLQIARNDLNQLIHAHHFKKQDLANLFCLYAARILYDVRNCHEPDIVKKQKAAEKRLQEENDQEWGKFKESFKVRHPTTKEVNQFLAVMSRKQRIIWTKATSNGNRNSNIPGITESLERHFVQTLVKLFPGKKGEVMKYIKLAGYEHAEAYYLIDRTVGRDAETEFLYKNRPKFKAKAEKNNK